MKRSFLIRGTVVLTLLAVAAVIASVSLAAAGAPTRPPAGPSPNPALAAHSLTYTPGPLDNPLKGFLPFFFARTNYEAKPLPHSMLWGYFALNEVMTSPTDCNYFDWSILEQMLDETASSGRQAVFRFYMEYPGGTGSHPANGIPHCLDGKVTYRTNGYWGTTSPDYDDPDTIQALTNFIHAFGAKYDGDPRIAYISMGLIGLWGEWHTWPYDRDTSDGYPDLFPTDQTVNTIIDAYDASFNKTKIVIRYPDLGGGHASAPGVNIGTSDDSWPYKEFRGSGLGGMTLPASMGGWPDAFLQLELNANGENKWSSQVVGGEVRPEIQGNLPAAWPNGAGQVDNVKAAIELTHLTWAINEQGVGGYNPADANVQAIIHSMGYELYVNSSYFNNVASGAPLAVGVRIENRAVAPFPYPWTVVLGLKNSSGTVVQTWDTNWDITKVQPLKIRAFPDWGAGADPTYLDFGYPLYYETTVGTAGISSGNYTLVMRVRNPLESITEADVRDNIESWQPFLPAKKVRFANAEQNSDGWLSLGAITVGATCTGCPTATPSSTPTTGPTSTATRTPTATSTNAPTATATTGPTQDPSSYEAESAANTLAGGAAAAACSGCSNGQKVGYVGNNTGTLQFNGVQAASAGSYPLTIYFASGEARSAQMSVNGGSPSTISFPSSGDWNTVASVQTTVTLNGGANTIKFSNSSGWAPDFDRVKLGSGSGGPTSTPSLTPAGPTNTPQPTATKTNTPIPTNTTAPTNTPLPSATATSGGGPLVIDSFGDAAKWGTNHLNDLNQTISCATMDSCYYGDANPGNIVMNSSPAGQYYQEGINRSLSGTSVLVLRLKDWWDSDTENHWTVVLNDGTDHSVALNAYGNVTASWQDISIPLSAFGANLNSVVYIRLVHKDATYAVLLIDTISAQ